jgi:hypothetical protein
MLRQYRLGKIGRGTLLEWLDDGWSREKLLKSGDAPTRWLAPKVRAALIEAADGRIADDEAQAAVVALVREYRRRRDVGLWPER